MRRRAPRGGLSGAPMKITRIELLPLSSPLKHPISMREETLRTIDGVVIRIHTDAGLVGLGDTGNTSPWYRGETQESVMAIIAKVFAPLCLLGQDPTSIERIVARMDFVARDNNQAKCLVDCALHDIKGKALGVPVYQLLGGKSVDRVRLGWVMSADQPDDAVTMARRAVAEGFDLLKLKTGGGTFEDDLRMIAAVREAVGEDVEMFIDVNGHWRYDEALAKLRRLEPFRLSLVEQPLAPWDIDGLARLRGKVGTPIYADEAAQELADLHRIIDKDAVDGLMLKVPKAGGLLKSQRWITLAQSAGYVVMCGCMAGSGLEAAAFTHLLAANAWASQFKHENLGPLHIHDVFNTVDAPITDDIALNVPRYQGGYVYPTETPGLGVELNEDAVARLGTPGMAPWTVEA